MKRFLPKLFADQRGATAIEYGLIIAMIVLAMFAALTSFAGSATGLWNEISTKVTTA